MTITTKIACGANCFFLHNNLVYEAKVDRIRITVDADGMYRTEEATETYEIENPEVALPRDKVFATKEELLASL